MLARFEPRRSSATAPEDNRKCESGADARARHRGARVHAHRAHLALEAAVPAGAAVHALRAGLAVEDAVTAGASGRTGSARLAEEGAMALGTTRRAGCARIAFAGTTGVRHAC